MPKKKKLKPGPNRFTKLVKLAMARNKIACLIEEHGLDDVMESHNLKFYKDKEFHKLRSSYLLARTALLKHLPEKPFEDDFFEDEEAGEHVYPAEEEDDDEDFMFSSPLFEDEDDNDDSDESLFVENYYN